jgi:hypothetical protein
MRKYQIEKETRMRRFHSYGPVNKNIHFCVPRVNLVQSCLDHIVGEPGYGGHYFTIWGPRQTGKTWLMRQVKERIETDYPDRFIVGCMSMQGVSMKETDEDSVFFSYIPLLMHRTFKLNVPEPDSWQTWQTCFYTEASIFSKPVILFIDEFDKLPSRVIDQLVNLFRDMYLEKENYLLHGLALIGVKAVLGVDSLRGSPFNIQRSLHVESFCRDEVQELFDQYQSESGQSVAPEVIAKVFEVTNGQPGLVGWFGELLTDKYNPDKKQPITLSGWETVYRRALYVEWNNTILNLIKKVRSGGYTSDVLALFTRSDVMFSLDVEGCTYLYLNGIIIPETVQESGREAVDVCRFSCPFIQKRLYNALALDLIGDRLPIPAVEIMDDLADVFEAGLHLPPLLARYKSYLVRMKAKGLNPFKDQPRRADLHYTEAVGHFHLYAWLQAAVGRRCVISPEFPTGNGKVDIHLNCGGRQGIIEVKSFIDISEVSNAQLQAAAYSGKLGLSSVTLALFVPTDDASILEKLSTQTAQNGVSVHVVAIGWT